MLFQPKDILNNIKRVTVAQPSCDSSHIETEYLCLWFSESEIAVCSRSGKSQGQLQLLETVMREVITSLAHTPHYFYQAGISTPVISGPSDFLI